MNQVKERNISLDFMKCISALGVIFVHAQFPGSPGKLLSAVGSVGVLFFFIISGYAAHGTRETVCPKLMKRFRRNLLLTICAAAVYLLVKLAELHQNGETAYALQSAVRQPRFYVRLLLLGDLDLIHGDPLWFMFALLYGYLIFWLIARFGWQRAACKAMPFFILLRIGMSIYKYAVDAEWHLCSNALVCALPMMLLGYVIAEKEDALRRLPFRAVILSCILSAIGTGITVFVNVFGYNLSPVFKIWAAAAFFVLALRKPQLHSIWKPVAWIGRACSLHVYLWHMPLIVLLYPVLEQRLPETVFPWAFPLIIAAAAVILAAGIAVCGSCIRTRRTTA